MWPSRNVGRGLRAAVAASLALAVAAAAADEVPIEERLAAASAERGERGAADYPVKPFSATELTARVQAALRTQAGPETFALGEPSVDYEARRVTVAGHPVRLTATEYELLRLLTVNAGRVSTYESLIRRLWNEPDGADPDRVCTFIKQVRRKLGDDPARPRWILNERGVGYRVPRPEE